MELLLASCAQTIPHTSYSDCLQINIQSVPAYSSIGHQIELFSIITETVFTKIRLRKAFIKYFRMLLSTGVHDIVLFDNLAAQNYDCYWADCVFKNIFENSHNVGKLITAYLKKSLDSYAFTNLGLTVQ